MGYETCNEKFSDQTDVVAFLPVTWPCYKGDSDLCFAVSVTFFLFFPSVSFDVSSSPASATGQGPTLSLFLSVFLSHTYTYSGAYDAYVYAICIQIYTVYLQ